MECPTNKGISYVKFDVWLGHDLKLDYYYLLLLYILYMSILEDLERILLGTAYMKIYVKGNLCKANAMESKKYHS